MSSHANPHHCAQELAYRYSVAPHWKPTDAYKVAIQQRTVELLGRIPVPIVPVPDEPCYNRQCLVDHIKQGILPVRIRNVGPHHRPHPVLGSLMTEFRAVHDYFGHVMTGFEFGLEGELAAYQEHCQYQFDAWLLPYVWQNVVLENAYYEHWGKWPHPISATTRKEFHQGPAPIVYDEVKFGKVDR